VGRVITGQGGEKAGGMLRKLDQLTDKQRAWVFLGGGIAVFIGSFMTWVKVTAVFIGTVTLAGTEGDGKITVGAAVVIMAGGLLVLQAKPKRWLSGLGVLAGLVSLGTATYDLWEVFTSDVTGKFGDKTQKLGTISPGTGLYLTFAGSLVAIVGAFIATRGRPDRPTVEF